MSVTERGRIFLVVGEEQGHLALEVVQTLTLDAFVFGNGPNELAKVGSMRYLKNNCSNITPVAEGHWNICCPDPEVEFASGKSELGHSEMSAFPRLALNLSIDLIL